MLLPLERWAYPASTLWYARDLRVAAMKLSFDALRALDAIEKTGSMARAGELLHRVPSALSYHVQKLEIDLDVALLDRSGRAAKLTEAGHMVLDEGRRLLAAVERLQLKVQRAQRGWEKKLEVCVDEALPLDALWTRIREFYALGVDTQLHVMSKTANDAWYALESRRADLILTAGPAPAWLAGFEVRCVGTLRYVFAVAPQHPLARVPEPLSGTVISQYRCAVVGNADSPPEDVLSVGKDQPFIRLSTMTAMVEAQCEGIVIGSIPEHTAAEPLALGRLVAKQVTGIAESSPCYLAWRKDVDVGRALRWWIGMLDQPDLIGAQPNSHFAVTTRINSSGHCVVG